ALAERGGEVAAAVAALEVEALAVLPDGQGDVAGRIGAALAERGGEVAAAVDALEGDALAVLPDGHHDVPGSVRCAVADLGGEVAAAVAALEFEARAVRPVGQGPVAGRIGPALAERGGEVAAAIEPVDGLRLDGLALDRPRLLAGGRCAVGALELLGQLVLHERLNPRHVLPPVGWVEGADPATTTQRAKPGWRWVVHPCFAENGFWRLSLFVCAPT